MQAKRNGTIRIPVADDDTALKHDLGVSRLIFDQATGRKAWEINTMWVIIVASSCMLSDRGRRRVP